MPAEPKHLLRPLRLFWARLGSLQIYFVALVAIVLALAAFGFWHLIVPRSPIIDHPITNAPPPAATPLLRRSPALRDEGGSPAPPTAAPTPAPLERRIAITDLTQSVRRGMRGETLVVAHIGLTPQTTAPKEQVEIDVAFFDLDRDNQMHPTDAQITYEWLTPERDWADPSPKYLAATYLQSPLSRRSALAKADEHLRYGGFIVRIYSDNKLQDTRSKPENLIANLPRNSPPPPAASSPSSQPSDSPAPPSRSSQQRTLNSQPYDSLPKGIVVPNKPGFVQSPYDPKFMIDVRGFPPGTLVNDPNTNKPYKVP